MLQASCGNAFARELVALEYDYVIHMMANKKNMIVYQFASVHDDNWSLSKAVVNIAMAIW